MPRSGEGPRVRIRRGGRPDGHQRPGPPGMLSSAPMHAERHHDLVDIARRAMRDHGLEPDFPPAVLAEAERLSPDLHDGDPSVRDLRGLPWSSIDNDDTRDLDQLEVAEALPGGAIKVLIAIA